MKDKMVRQTAIRDLVANEKIKTQEDLISKLKERGISATQATLSRDMVDLGIVKASDGCYIYEDDFKFARLGAEFIRDVIPAGNMVLIKCSEGAAAGVAAAFDRMAWEEVLGSVAGDDTILLVTMTSSQADSVSARLKGLIKN